MRRVAVLLGVLGVPLLAGGCTGGRAGLGSDGTYGVPSAAAGIPRGAVRVEVVRVVDGDTLVVRTRGRRQRVRLIGVDAPEATTRRECFGDRATRALWRLARPGTTLWTRRDRQPRDRYRRMLLYAWTADGEFVNVALVRRGNAQAMLVPPNDRYIRALRTAETRARRAAAGLWSACARTPG